eukprot:4292327-Lingulodinium_polyedra.AAC.1
MGTKMPFGHCVRGRQGWLGSAKVQSPCTANVHCGSLGLKAEGLSVQYAAVRASMLLRGGGIVVPGEGSMLV